MARKIDYDRGVIISQHKASGMDVFMYVDTPGVYLNAFGTPVSDQLAKEAGYDVEKFGKDKLKRERMAKAMTAIEAELAIADEVGKKNVIEEKGGFKIVDLGVGRHYVEDAEGNRLNSIPLPVEQARVLLAQLVVDVPKATQGPAPKK